MSQKIEFKKKKKKREKEKRNWMINSGKQTEIDKLEDRIQERERGRIFSRFFEILSCKLA